MTFVQRESFCTAQYLDALESGTPAHNKEKSTYFIVCEKARLNRNVFSQVLNSDSAGDLSDWQAVNSRQMEHTYVHWTDMRWVFVVVVVVVVVASFACYRVRSCDNKPQKQMRCDSDRKRKKKQ